MGKRMFVPLIALLVLGACIGPQPAAAPATQTAAVPLSRAVAVASTPDMPEQVILIWPSLTAVYELQAAASASPTATPHETATPDPTATATPVPTATAEHGTPIPTPYPTSPPTEEPGCYGTVEIGALNIRTGPATVAPDGTMTYAAKTGRALVHGERVRIVDVVYVYVADLRTDEWVRLYASDDRQGWSAALFGHEVYIRYDRSDECLPVRFPELPAITWHALPSANAMEMVASYNPLRAGGLRYGSRPYADAGMCRDAIYAGGICIYRNPPGLTDCPNVPSSEQIRDGTGPDPRAEARRWMALVEASTVAPMRDVIPTGRFVAEVTNECRVEWDAYYWWRDFIDEAVTYAMSHQWPPMILPTLGPGWGDAEMLRVLKPSLLRLIGIGGYFGLHNYNPGEGVPLCVSNDWLGYRHRRLYREALALGLGDLRFMLTEVAPGWGNEPVDEADLACWAVEVLKDPYVAAVSFWTAGYDIRWWKANLDGHMVPIGQQIAERWRALVGL